MSSAAEAVRLLLPGAALVLVLMGGLWVFHLRVKDAGVVDVGWAAGLGLLALYYAAVGPGWAARRALVGILGGVWAFRLASHLARRMRGKPEEGRYAALREEWTARGRNVSGAFLVFFLAQGLLDVLLSWPFLLAASDARPAFSGAEAAGGVLWLVSVGGESLADLQLVRFKADAANAGKVCREGLWNLSRHPNYFFEWLVWCAFALLAFDAPLGPTALVCPALMLFFLLRITGIPATEAQAVRSKGEAYRRYQREVSAFFPWFSRSGAA
ncbi:MAG TPA: DUF1295 domain-containing protein [Thermoanaerobaculia bacterium]|nr:DUF1295 domain-containing protein [Thermoanaerobaculia bacterium]